MYWFVFVFLVFVGFLFLSVCGILIDFYYEMFYVCYLYEGWCVC